MKRKPSKSSSLLAAALNAARFFLVVLLTYLLHTCLMPEIRILGVTPNLIIAVLGVVAVCFERVKTLWYGLIMGILLEVMLPTTPLLSLLLYPIIAALCMLIFSDKSMQQLEYERGLGKPGRNRPAWLRTPLCAAFGTTVYEIVNIAYVYLRGTDIEFSHILRGLINVLLTAALALVLMVPLRRFFGIRVARNPNRDLKPAPYRRNP